ncbi:UDP-glucose 4-epimerase GalE [Flavobacteriaceae bacterium]|jgi:UDP-glucose 4-epimerase|nr:UDP-glucose 4-epimerase GalE [Flavobacteriaceae bacterium]MBT4231468.1 UDP-glucose 4-epimerase GalE [Flavobacteriaceae bacterium]MBT5393218.1 UDP-glucose 4-epimerase GalE [Flavobacteriaceae bacterium]MDA9616799.1 UDP-glucose 4-epimerase GalE [Flavobacteriaceae bacterium]
MPKILVTGGLGYIGSHTVVELHKQGFEVIIVDDLSNTSLDVLERVNKITNSSINYVNLDLKNIEATKIFISENNDIDGVIHFAASKAVGESVENPLKYYTNNLFSLTNLLNELKDLNKEINFIFSSSATVYGNPEIVPITESEPIKKAESPYGNTKQIGEEIIKDLVYSNSNFKAISLRYFNPIGAHSSAMIGELPIGVPQNLVPFITQTAIGLRKELTVFGNDYPTSDGSCLRDYIHVMDLAKAHIKSLYKLINNEDKSYYDTFNIGTGKGTSVLELIKCFENVTENKLNFKIGDRREGDVAECFADVSKANKILNWKSELSIKDSLLSSWNWEKNINNEKLQ